MQSRILNNPPKPGTHEWMQTISASKIPAILGISRFKSQFALWHEMAGNIKPEELDPRRMAWGHAAEQSIAEMWKFDNPGWKLNPLRTMPDGTRTHEICYTRDDIGFPNIATIDRRAWLPGSHPKDPDRFRIIECKTAQNLDDWGRPGEDDAVPADYYAQVIWQMGVSGIHKADIMVLAYGSGPELHTIEWDEDIFDMTVERARAWHKSHLAGVPPALDDSKSCYEAIRALHPDINRGEEVEIDLQTAEEYLAAMEAEKNAAAKAREMKSMMGVIMGNAHKAMCGGVKIADRRRTSSGGVSIYANHKADLGEVA